MQIIENIAMVPGFCLGLSMFSFLCAVVMTDLLLGSLLKMHRSKSAVKKIMKQYRFLEKLWLVPFEDNCLHAVKFCKFLILYQRIGWLILGVYLAFALAVLLGLPARELLAWFTAGRFLCFDGAFLIMNLVLSRPIIGRFREFSFEKYHNTDNHDSLL